MTMLNLVVVSDIISKAQTVEEKLGSMNIFKICESKDSINRFKHNQLHYRPGGICLSTSIRRIKNLSPARTI